MLISKKEITSIQPPLLMQISNGNWKLVLKTTNHATFDMEILERDKDEFSKRVISQQQQPFYVGADVWELNYGATLMTLNHETLAGHPAQQLWIDWLNNNQ